MTKRHSRSQLLMQNLIYPAILGNLLFLTISRVSSLAALNSAIADRTILYALSLLCVFAMSYLTNFVTKPRNYGALAFAVDIGEIINGYVVFYSMNYVPNPDDKTKVVNWQVMFICLAIAPLLEWYWDHITEEPSRVNPKLILSLSFVFAVSAFFAEDWVFMRTTGAFIIFVVMFLWWFKLGKDKRFAVARFAALLRYLRRHLH